MMPLSFTVRRSLSRVLDRIEVAARQKQGCGSEVPRLVAVSKKKTVDHIIAAYNYGQRHFGENYVPEFLEKARDPRITAGAPDIHWHYIGSLQKSNQCKHLAAIPNLWMVETVPSDRISKALDKAWRNQKHGAERNLRVMVQINTSSEAGKSGCNPGDAVLIVKHILENCDSLEFSGLMTIGSLKNSERCATDPTFVNPDFEVLREVREKLCKDLALCADQMELSMGMTADMDHAVAMGSSNIRVGTAIFGSRDDGIYASESFPEETSSSVSGQLLYARS